MPRAVTGGGVGTPVLRSTWCSAHLIVDWGAQGLSDSPVGARTQPWRSWFVLTAVLFLRSHPWVDTPASCPEPVPA